MRSTQRARVANHAADGAYSQQFGPEGRWTLPTE